MSAILVTLDVGRSNRGKFPVSLRREKDVVVTGQVNPHNGVEIDNFIERACDSLPGLEAQRKELRQQLLNLAKPVGTRRPQPHEHPYINSQGGIHWLKLTSEFEALVPLTNFTAQILGDIVRDDGTEQNTFFQIEAVLGGRSTTFTVPAGRFSSMSWVTENLGAQAIVYPGQSIRDHARAAIQFLSPHPVPRKTIYTHTGWRKLDGGNGGLQKWVYLHTGGAIGSSGKVEGVEVDLPVALTPYALPDPPQGDELCAAIRASLGMLMLTAAQAVFPAFCSIWRAALGTCDFGLHFAGPTGVFKSELAALVQQHFGPGLDARHLPGSWHSTDNALEGLLFAAKDAVTVVDDFAPSGGPHDEARWHQRAERIFRAQGNNAGRGRMRSDGSLRPPKPPRGLVLSTGEEIPRGQSIRARILILEISKGEIDADILTQCQGQARNGLYAAATAGFVRYIAPRYEQILHSFRDKVEALRREAAEGTSHCRTPDIVANLALGLRHFIAFALEAGAISEVEAAELWKNGWAALVQAGRAQADHQAANEPARRFIELTKSALGSGHAHVAGEDGGAPKNAGAWGWRMGNKGEWEAQGDRIGWIDGDDVFLEPDASYSAANKMGGARGDGLSITARTLRKRMDEMNMVVRPGDREELLTRKVLEGRTRSVLHLAAGVLSPESTIPTIPTGKALGESKNSGGMVAATVGNSPVHKKTHHRQPPSTARAVPENGGDGGNGGNGGKPIGDTCAVIDCSANSRERGRV
jgi:hypothetical protein